eukprot:6803936-Pyramimonas_sp.AAC.1
MSAADIVNCHTADRDDALSQVQTVQYGVRYMVHVEQNGKYLQYIRYGALTYYERAQCNSVQYAVH